ncbi:MAG: hypothetical protein APR62_03060 [Smithella sp. SDB]|nr:MAG: hypothetical protein APR62_03060 [Smithella sp. SDB]
MKSIKYIGFNDSTGYGIAARTMVSALRKENANVNWVPVVAGTSAYNPYSITQIREGYKNVIIHTVPEYYPYWLKFEQEQKIKPKKIWGYTTWETDKIPRHWAKLLNVMDGIFVPCNWNKEVFQKCGVQTRIEILPHISQFHGDVPNGLPSAKLNKLMEQMAGRFVFYNIGVWSDRKAPWLLIESFLSEFSSHEPVTLIMKTGKLDFTNYKRKWTRPWRFALGEAAVAFRKIMRSKTNGPEVIHLDEEFSDTDIAWLHKRGDCFVSLGRGEGWGMGSYEAAWCGKPIIITGFGGVLDYLPASLSYHVKHKVIPVHGNAYCGSYTIDQRWADPDLAHARQLMRQVFESQKSSAEKGMQLRDYVSQNFNSVLIAQRCLDTLKPEQ